VYRIILFSVIIAILVICVSTSCAPQSEKVDTNIQFEEDTYDFGVNDEGKNLEHDFMFTNTERDPLSIRDVVPNCSCTVVGDWDKIVAPSKVGKIHITMKTKGLQGDVAKTIVVKTNVPKRENLLLTIKANVKTPISINPRNVFLGEVLPGEVKFLSGSFEIDNHLNAPLRILSISPPDRTTFTLTTLVQNMKYKVDFTVAPPFAGESMIKGEFKIKTDSKEYPELVPTFSYFIPPQLNVFPSTIKIDIDDLEGYVIPFMTTINIKSAMDKPIRIEGLKLVGGKGIKYEILEAEKDSFYQILITIPVKYAYNKNEKINFIFRVQNDPKNKEYNIPVRFVKKGENE
jgi:hypothetical protein